MSINPAQAQEALTLAVRNEFADTYTNTYAGVLENMSPVMELGIGSNQFKEIYAYAESSPFPRRIPEGEALHTKAYRYRSYEIVNYTWGTGVEWLRKHAQYDQLGTVERDARRSGANFATLPERVFFQLIRQATDSDLLPSIPNAPDGAAIYATTAGGAARFGATNGNLLTGSGVATAQAIRDDFYSSVEQFHLFQDTEGEPLLPPGDLDAGFTIFFGAANMQIFNEAFFQVRSLDGSVTPSNVILDAGITVRLIPTQRITDNDWFVFANGVDLKPIFEQVASPLIEMPYDESNSDRARDYQISGVKWIADRGYGVNLPYGTIKVNN
jgi:hypothetical protein